MTRLIKEVRPLVGTCTILSNLHAKCGSRQVLPAIFVLLKSISLTPAKCDPLFRQLAKPQHISGFHLQLDTRIVNLLI